MYRQEEKYGPRLAVVLCHVSSEDDARPAAALRSQTRASCGWQSGKHCSYPQELGFRFEGAVSLDSLRLLAHESKIPSCVEVLVAQSTQQEMAAGVCGPYEAAVFSRVGHIRFSTNVVHDYCARELKTVGVRRQCTYLKLVSRRPHSNGYNLFHQIGFVAMTAHGVLLRSLDYPPTGNVPHVVVGEISKIPLDEMMPLTAAEANAADPDTVRGTASEIENLSRWKARAVAEEDYDLAAKLKAQMDQLQDAGPHIARLEADKQRAVGDEDYARAKQLKRQIDALVSRDSLASISLRSAQPAAAAAAVPRDGNRSTGNNSGSVGSSASAATAPTFSTAAAAGGGRNLGPAQVLPAASGSEPSAMRSKLPGLSGFPAVLDGHDEVTVGGKGFYDLDDASDPFGLPGVNRSSLDVAAEVSLAGDGAPWERQLNTAIAGFVTDKSTPLVLSGDAAQDAKPLDGALGVYCGACLLARRGQLREAAIRGVVSKTGLRAVASHSSGGVEALMNYLASRGRGVSDPIPGVVFASCNALQKIAEGRLDNGGGVVPAAGQLASQFGKIAPELVGRLGDANARVRENVEATIAAISQSSIGPDSLVALLVVDPDKESKKPASYRAHLGRINLLSSFVDVYGAGGSHTLDTRQLMTQVVQPSLQHASSEVRDAASRLFAKLIARDPATARPYLADLKPAQQAAVEELVLLSLDAAASDEADGTARVPRVPRRLLGGPQTPLSAAAQHRSSEGEGGSDARRRRQQQDQDQAKQRATPEMDVETRSVHRADAFAARNNAVAPPSSSGSSRTTSGRTSPSRANLSAATGGGGTSPMDAEYRDSHTCQFCVEFNKNFTEKNLDIHYVRACPMLCPCPLCDQVTEICTLQQHLVSECEGMRLVRECPRCREAVRSEDFKRHVAAQNCIEAVAAYSVCPLCHDRFMAGMDGWRMHLAASPGCPNNPRKHDGTGPVLQ